MRDFVALRTMMVKKQLEERGISNPAVLEAMRTVPREEFIPADLLSLAYEDGPLSLEEGQSITQPYMVAYMIEALEPAPGDRVLEIGTGSGDGAAVLSRIAKDVFTIERIALLAGNGREHLSHLGYTNVNVKVGDGRLGCTVRRHHGDRMCAENTETPHGAAFRRGTDGVIPVGPHPYTQTLIKVRRLKGNKYSQKKLRGLCSSPLLVQPVGLPERWGPNGLGYKQKKHGQGCEALKAVFAFWELSLDYGW